MTKRFVSNPVSLVIIIIFGIIFLKVCGAYVLPPSKFNHQNYCPLHHHIDKHDGMQKKRDHMEFHVAPMQCYTNLPMRTLLRSLSPDAILWTEMEKVTDLIKADYVGLLRRFGPPGFKDIVLQLGGNDEQSIRQCIQELTNNGYTFREINLNCGCPSIESGGSNTYGASLMKQPVLTRNLLESIRESTVGSAATTNVSLKCRIAVYDTVDEIGTNTGQETLTEQQYSYLHKYVSEAQQAGISHLVLHARAAVLKGLSPKKNRHVPILDYGTVERVAKDFPFKVTLNGGISSLPLLSSLQSSRQDAVSSFMAGRWMLRKPLDLIRVQSLIISEQQQQQLDLKGSKQNRRILRNGKGAITKMTATTMIPQQALEEYIDYFMRSIDDKKSFVPLNELCLPLYMITEQLREMYEQQHTNIGQREEASDIWLSEGEVKAIYDLICTSITWVQERRGSSKIKKPSCDSIELKKLSNCFKSLVGTKVANKWKKNRTEL